MLTPESRTWRIGPYTVKQAVRPDNPAFPQYLILRDGQLIGKSFSVPDLGCCQSLERACAPAPEAQLRGRMDAEYVAKARLRGSAKYVRGRAVKRVLESA